MAEAATQFDHEAVVFAPSLPSNIPLDRFRATVIWALNENPDLLRADRRSLMNACAKAANDGLLPDKKEGALVVFNTNERKKVGSKWVDNWIKKVQWMPMVYGITKKALASGQVLSLYAKIVYQAEIDAKKFSYRIEDGHHRLNHEPILWGDQGEPVFAYAVAILASGVVEVEPMRQEDLDKIKRVSRAKDREGNPTGPWKEWTDEMWKKSPIRRLSKRIPFSADVEQVIRCDDELVDLSQDPAGEPAPLTQSVTTAAALMGGEGFTGGEAAAAESEPVILEGEFTSEESGESESEETPSPPAEEPTEEQMLENAKGFGRDAAAKGMTSLKSWWDGLARDVQMKLLAFKDDELKKTAQQFDAKKADF